MNKTVDVLIIGAGGAGLRAAIAAADRGVSVLLTSKANVACSGATSYPVAEMAGYNAGDISIPLDVQKHYDDIVKAGQGMADHHLAAIVAARAPETIQELEGWGVHFEHENGGYYVFKSCFSSTPRTHVIKKHGIPIIHALKQQLDLRQNVEILDGITLMGLLIQDGCCVGAYGYTHGEMVYISAKAVILATGGCGQAFERNMNPPDVTGDGYAMAYLAGAELVNMEYLQIGMGFSKPVVNIFNGYIWEARPKLWDKDGKDIFGGILPEAVTEDEVMHEHRKHFPFSTSDNSKYLEIAVHRAIRDGRGSASRGITADLTHLTDDYISQLEDDCGIRHMWPIARDYMLSKHVDLLHQRVEVALYAHAVNGGVKIDSEAMSTIPGLFAAGECAGGPHGADRLGGNMMVTCQVFGKIAGTHAAEYALRLSRAGVNSSFAGSKDEQMAQMLEILHKQINTSEMLRQLRRCTQDNLLVARTEAGLTSLEDLVEQLKQELFSAPNGKTARPQNVDLYHMLTAVSLMTKSAKARKESRGSHHRADYPLKNAQYNHPITIHK